MNNSSLLLPDLILSVLLYISILYPTFLVTCWIVSVNNTCTPTPCETETTTNHTASGNHPPFPVLTAVLTVAVFVVLGVCVCVCVVASSSPSPMALHYTQEALEALFGTRERVEGLLPYFQKIADPDAAG